MSEFQAGEIVSGLVVRHEPFGFFVDIGDTELGVVVITMIKDDESTPNPEFPPVGNRIDAVFLGYSGPRRQPRLSTRPMDMQQARA